MFKNIIWASDGSEAAATALPAALELVEAAHGTLLIVHADERLAAKVGGGPVLADEAEIQARLEEQVRDLAETGTEVGFRVIHGAHRQPADLIADVARETHADAIVVGTRGHGRLTGALLGSVTQRLLHVAPCAVLAVPARVRATAGAH